MYTLRKKKRKTQFASHIPPLPFFSSISRISSFFKVCFYENSKKQSNFFPLQKQSSVYILQPARALFTNHTKRTTIKAVSHLSHLFSATSPNTSLFTDLRAPAQHQSQTENQERVEEQSGSINSEVPVYWESTRGRVPLNQMLTDSRWKRIWCHQAVSRKQVLTRPGGDCVSSFRVKLVLLDSGFVKPAEALGEVPAQGDGEDIDEAEQSEGVEQHHCVLQEG